MFLLASPVSELVLHWEKALPETAVVMRVADLPSLEKAMAERKPAILLLDFDFPGLDGVAGVSALQKFSPSTRVLVSTAAFDAEDELALLRVGVMGCCRKDIEPALLNRILTVVREGGLWVTRSLIPGLIEEIRTRHPAMVRPDHVVQTAHLHQLTPRELEVAGLVGSGASNKQIARTLNICDRTVKAHLSTIFQKLGVSDRLQLALYINGHRGESGDSVGKTGMS